MESTALIRERYGNVVDFGNLTDLEIDCIKFDTEMEHRDFGEAVEAYLKRKNSPSEEEETEGQPKKQAKLQEEKKKKAKPQEKKVPENRAVFVSNLPQDTTLEELDQVFKRFGIIDKGVDGNPRIKMYTDEEDKFNRTALIVYFKRDSVALAITMQDDYELRPGDFSSGKIKVEEADPSFKKHTDADKIAGSLVRKDRKAAERNRAEMNRKLAEWSDNEDEVKEAYAPKKNKWAKLAIIKKAFILEDLEDDDAAILEIKEDMRKKAEEFGEVTKVVLYDKEADGILTVRFKEFEDAEKFRDGVQGSGYNNGHLEISIAEDKPKFSKGADPEDIAAMRRFMSNGNDDDDEDEDENVAVAKPSAS